MSLAKQHKLNPAKLTGNRSSSRRLRREVKRSTKAQILNLEKTGNPGKASKNNLKRSHDPDRSWPVEAKLGSGFYLHSVQATLADPGHDPADFQRRLDALMEICQPENAREMGLVLRLTQQITDLLTSIKQAARTY